MPRHYKHKLGTPHRRNYNANQMERALEFVLNQQLSFQQAADRVGVPKATLWKKYRGLHGDQLGRPPAISVPEEKLIVSAILTAAEFRMPFTKDGLKDFIQQYLNRKGVIVRAFNNNRPGDDWYEYFMNRNSELAIRNSQNIKRCRAELTPAVLTEFFEHLRSTIENISPENIINYDETNMTDDPGSQKVIVRRGTKHASRVMDSSKTSTSVMFAGAADGTFLPPYVVFKAKYIYPDWVEGGPVGARFNRTSSGWFDSDVYEDWFFKLALPYLRRKEGRKVIIGDNLGSHLSYKVIKACEENNVAFIFLPKNSTHICQPLDVAVFRPLKLAWRKTLTQWKLHNKGVIPKSIFPSLLKKMLDETSENMKTNIVAGFKATGISPFDPQKVLSKIKPRINGIGDENARVLVESFTEVMTDLTKVNDRNAPKRKTRIDVPAGQSVSSADLSGAGPSGIEQQSPAEQEESEISNSPNHLNQDTISEMDYFDDEDTGEAKTEVKCAKDINENDFVIVSFRYNEGTKKECAKEFVCRILKIKKSEIVVSCLRMYKGRKNSFVFPPIEDIAKVNLLQIKFNLKAPTESRGIYTFNWEVL